MFGIWGAKCYLIYFVYRIEFCKTNINFVDKINSVLDEIEFSVRNCILSDKNHDWIQNKFHLRPISIL